MKHVKENLTVGFIGAGRMAQAMARGFISTGMLKASNITASGPNPGRLQIIKDLGVNTTTINKEVVQNSEIVFITVNPHMVTHVLREVSTTVSKDKLIVSIAAGITLSTLEENLPPATRVIRVVTNTSALVQAGASVIALGSGVLPGDSDLISELLESIGICETASETLMDTVTGLSGAAYGFMAIESLADGGVKMGLPRDLAQKLAAQNLLGAAKMVLETGNHPGQLKDDLCSPGGTTIALVQVLEKSGFRGSLIDAIETATLRARELGNKK